MHTQAARYLVVVLLILGACGLSLGLGLEAAPAPRLPSGQALTAASPWQVSVTYAPGDLGMAYQQWLLRDRSGREALLFVGTTSRPQTMLRWTGELGYQGEGYLVTEKRQTEVNVAGSSWLPAEEAVIQHLDDRRLLEYSVVGPGGRTVAQSTDLIPEVAWTGLQGRSVGYYMVRVSVPATPGAAPAAPVAADVLRSVLPRLTSLAATQ